MSQDSHTKTTSTSYFGRIGNAFGAVLIGFLLFAASFVVLSWNEGRAVKREKLLNEGSGRVVTVSSEQILPENNGRLIHFTGMAKAGSPVSDPVSGISAEALKLRRQVEMYQWQQSEKSETKQKIGGGEETTTTYSYSKAWSPTPIDSSAFQVPAGHTNPRSLPVESATFTADGIHVGAFVLPPGLTAQINNFSPLAVAPGQAAGAGPAMQLTAGPDGRLYSGRDPANPSVGDLRITLEQALPGPVSVMAAQAGNSLEPYRVDKMGSIEFLRTGTLDAAAMFQMEHDDNTILTWVLRLVGFVMMLTGLMMITNVVSVMASVIPFLGNIVGAGVGLMAFAVALPLTLLTISLAWLAYRPLVGIPLLLVAGASIFFAAAKLRRKPARG